MHRPRLPVLVAALLLCTCGAARSAAAQDQPKPQLTLPPAGQIVLLIRLSLLTLNDAIQSGNFTVLRDRGSPAFRQANTASDLARIFATLEAQRPDLAAVAILTPHLSEAQIVGPEQRLHVKGNFPSRPKQIEFDLMYEPADGQWQLFGLSVGAVPAPQAEAAAPSAAGATVANPAASKPAQTKPAPTKPVQAKPVQPNSQAR